MTDEVENKDLQNLIAGKGSEEHPQKLVDVLRDSDVDGWVKDGDENLLGYHEGADGLGDLVKRVRDRIEKRTLRDDPEGLDNGLETK